MRNPVTVDAAEYAALRAVATSAREWQLGRISGLAHADTIRTHLPALNLAPGRTEAWPEQDPEPVPGVDYAPRIGEWGYARLAEDDDPAPLRAGIDGYVPAPNWPDYRQVAA